MKDKIKKNLHQFDRWIMMVLGVIFVLVGVYIYEHLLFQLLSLSVALYFFFHGATGYCSWHRRLGQTGVGKLLNHVSLGMLSVAGMQLILAYSWLAAGYEKISGGTFVSGINKTLSYFISQNPYEWYVSFVEAVAMPYATVFALAIEWTQLIGGVILVAAVWLLVYGKQRSGQKVAAVMSVIALVALAFMNVNFYLAAGWTGPGTHSVNVIMFWTQLLLIYWWLVYYQLPNAKK